VSIFDPGIPFHPFLHPLSKRNTVSVFRVSWYPYHFRIVNNKRGDIKMFTYDEKRYLLTLLKKQKRKSFFRNTPEINSRLIEKLEQMIRNEEVNNNELKNKL
jgi:hypothetical protein